MENRNGEVLRVSQPFCRKQKKWFPHLGECRLLLYSRPFLLLLLLLLVARVTLTKQHDCVCIFMAIFPPFFLLLSSPMKILRIYRKWGGGNLQRKYKTKWNKRRRRECGGRNKRASIDRKGTKKATVDEFHVGRQQAWETTTTPSPLSWRRVSSDAREWDKNRVDRVVEFLHCRRR